MHGKNAVVLCAGLIKQILLETSCKTIMREDLLLRWKKEFPAQRATIWVGPELEISHGTIAKKNVSKSCRSLEELGIIKRCGNKIEVNNIQRLVQLCNEGIQYIESREN